jgi:hypothetical protein
VSHDQYLDSARTQLATDKLNRVPGKHGAEHLESLLAMPETHAERYELCEENGLASYRTLRPYAAHVSNGGDEDQE